MSRGDPSEIPIGAVVREQVYPFARSLGPLIQMMEDANSNWDGLHSSYHSSEEERVYRALAIPTNLVGDLKVLLDEARDALLEFVDTLTALNSQRAALVQEGREIDVVDTEAVVDLDERVRDFETAFEEADRRCADALLAMQMSTAPLTEIIEGLEDPSAAAATDLLLGAIGEVAGLEVYYGNSSITVFDPDVVLVDPIPDQTTRGVPYTFLPNGRRVPTYGLSGGQLAPVRGLHVPGGAYTADLPGRWWSAPLWLRDTNRFLIGAGAVFTVYAATAEYFNESLLLDPEMSDTDRFWEAVNYGVVVGGSEAVGSFLYGGIIAIAGSTLTPFVGIPLGIAASETGARAGEDFGEWMWELIT